MICKIILIINNTLTTPRIIFCGVCFSCAWHTSQSHLQSRTTKIQDRPNINAENTNNQGSTHSGIKYEECAISGANKLNTAKTIGKTQQNKCGKTVAMIPILIALFFIMYFPKELINLYFQHGDGILCWGGMSQRDVQISPQAHLFWDYDQYVRILLKF